MAVATAMSSAASSAYASSRGGLSSVPSDVADGEPEPVVGAVKGVVPVAADVHPGFRREVAGREPHEGRARKASREDGALEDRGDLALLLEQLGPLDGQRALARHRRQEEPLARLEPLLLGPTEGQKPHDISPRDQWKMGEGTHAECLGSGAQVGVVAQVLGEGAVEERPPRGESVAGGGWRAGRDLGHEASHLVGDGFEAQEPDRPTVDVQQQHGGIGGAEERGRT